MGEGPEVRRDSRGTGESYLALCDRLARERRQSSYDYNRAILVAGLIGALSACRPADDVPAAASAPLIELAVERSFPNISAPRAHL